MPQNKIKAILENLEKEDLESIQELLGHEDDTAGGLMTTEYLAYNKNITVEEALKRFKEDAEDVETIYYLYVIDDEDKLLGILSLRELLLSPPEVTLSEIMITNIKSIAP
ncbi:Cystathionine beta-synthase, core domain protein, partial [Candidatus Magnetoovum chiemensis]